MIRAALVLSLLTLAPTMNDCGGGSQWDQPQKRPAQCAPRVAFWKPAEGTVRDVKVCTSSFFGVTDERTYVKIKSEWPSEETVWVVDTQGGCDPGDRWAVFEPQGPARCE
jgi:hypothetical protein